MTNRDKLRDGETFAACMGRPALELRLRTAADEQESQLRDAIEEVEQSHAALDRIAQAAGLDAWIAPAQVADAAESLAMRLRIAEAAIELILEKAGELPETAEAIAERGALPDLVGAHRRADLAEALRGARAVLRH